MLVKSISYVLKMGLERDMISTSEGRNPMTKETQRPSKDQKPPRRPSHERVVENLDKWANSSGLEPPK